MDTHFVNVRLAIALLHEVHRRRSGDFAGLGAIFYQPPMDLPAVDLGVTDTLPCEFPVSGLKAIATLLAKISGKESAWHDGFHLIDVRSFSLTKLSQFLSPPLDLTHPNVRIERPLGARQMAAALTSRLPSVRFAALLSSAGEIRIYRRGLCIYKEKFENEQS